MPVVHKTKRVRFIQAAMLGLGAGAAFAAGAITADLHVAAFGIILTGVALLSVALGFRGI